MAQNNAPVAAMEEGSNDDESSRASTPAEREELVFQTPTDNINTYWLPTQQQQRIANLPQYPHDIGRMDGSNFTAIPTVVRAGVNLQHTLVDWIAQYGIAMAAHGGFIKIMLHSDKCVTEAEVRTLLGPSRMQGASLENVIDIEKGTRGFYESKKDYFRRVGAKQTYLTYMLANSERLDQTEVPQQINAEIANAMEATRWIDGLLHQQRTAEVPYRQLAREFVMNIKSTRILNKKFSIRTLDNPLRQVLMATDQRPAAYINYTVSSMAFFARGAIANFAVNQNDSWLIIHNHIGSLLYAIIPALYTTRFVQFMAAVFPDKAATCRDWLSHDEVMAQISALRANRICVATVN